eukprot:4393572-Amphidinium_carterae.2
MMAKLSRRHHRMDIYTGCHEYFTYLRRFKSHFRVFLAVPEFPPLEQPHPQTAARLSMYTSDWHSTPLPSWTRFAQAIVEADNFPEPERTELRHFEEPFESVFWMGVEFNALAYDIILRQYAELAMKIFTDRVPAGNSFRFTQKCLLETFVEHPPTARLATPSMPFLNNVSNDFLNIHQYILSLKPNQTPSYTTQAVRYKPGIAEQKMHPAIIIPTHLVGSALPIIQEFYQYSLVEAPRIPEEDSVPCQPLPYREIAQPGIANPISPTLPMPSQQPCEDSGSETSQSGSQSSIPDTVSYHADPPTISSLGNMTLR